MIKRYPSVADAIADIPDGATVMMGGFGASGSPIELIHALIDQGAKDLTVINNNTGNGEVGLAALIGNGQVRKMICSFPRSSQSRVFPELYKAGKIELELVPQGTLAERIRAAGAGIPAFYTPTTVGTVLAEGKETRQFDGRTYVMEPWLKADFALIKCEIADPPGQPDLQQDRPEFQPADVHGRHDHHRADGKLVARGDIDPEHVITPGIFVNRIVEVSDPVHEDTLIAEGRSYP